MLIVYSRAEVGDSLFRQQRQHSVFTWTQAGLSLNSHDPPLTVSSTCDCYSRATLHWLRRGIVLCCTWIQWDAAAPECQRPLGLSVASLFLSPKLEMRPSPRMSQICGACSLSSDCRGHSRCQSWRQITQGLCPTLNMTKLMWNSVCLRCSSLLLLVSHRWRNPAGAGSEPQKGRPSSTVAPHKHFPPPVM